MNALAAFLGYTKSQGERYSVKCNRREYSKSPPACQATGRKLNMTNCVSKTNIFETPGLSSLKTLPET